MRFYATVLVALVAAATAAPQACTKIVKEGEVNPEVAKTDIYKRCRGGIPW
ncbi:hypothetical protein K4F52_009753 [Lecanicillium sp. MT-2017a]|nr:hypothetical protein K4F52_009753 [Lecanicillium sp. MT-2017a]